MVQLKRKTRKTARALTPFERGMAIGYKLAMQGYTPQQASKAAKSLAVKGSFRELLGEVKKMQSTLRATGETLNRDHAPVQKADKAKLYSFVKQMKSMIAGPLFNDEQMLNSRYGSTAKRSCERVIYDLMSAITDSKVRSDMGYALRQSSLELDRVVDAINNITIGRRDRV